MNTCLPGGHIRIQLKHLAARPAIEVNGPRRGARVEVVGYGIAQAAVQWVNIEVAIDGALGLKRVSTRFTAHQRRTYPAAADSTHRSLGRAQRAGVDLLSVVCCEERGPAVHRGHYARRREDRFLLTP
jgi:hypothetical protein